MKLVAAKCPNCGSNLEVNPNKETIKCEYCRSAILVDEAIAKYKLEISGEIEIKNLPKLENYLKNAERYYSSKEYDEAYKIYKEILKLDPTNSLALLRYGICKTLLNNYIDFTLEYLNKTIKEVICLIKEDDNYSVIIEKYIKEVCNAVDESLYEVRKYFNSYTVNASDLMEIQAKLLSIVECYETIINYTEENKKHIIEQLVSVLNDIIKDKNYKTGTAREGGNFISTFKLSTSEKNIYRKKLKYYNDVLNSQEKNDNNHYHDLETSSKNNDKINLCIIIIDIFLWMLILGSAMSNQFISSLIMIFIFLLITIKKISNKIFKGDKIKKRNCLILLIIVLVIAIGCGI